jgi:acyl carrier protein
MKEDEVYASLAQVFANVFLRDDIKLTPELSADAVEDWDSFKQIELLMAVEDQFSIKISTREMDGLKNVGDLVRVIIAKGRSG